MTANTVSDDRRSRRIAFTHTAAVSVAFVSGSFALIALLLGSPLEYGTALALCATAWIVAHLAERFAEHERARHRPPSRSRDRITADRERVLTTV